jgi:hypothetical protein
MAYMNQERKATLAPGIKAVFKKYGAKGSIKVRHKMTLVVTISESPFEVGSDHRQVNEYHIKSNYSGQLQSFLLELRAAMMTGNHDRSDSQTDYFDVGWYIEIQFGQWDKPHRTLVAA